MKKQLFAFCLMAAFAAAVNARETDFPELSGPYLGQKPPGMTPEIFAPGIFSKEREQCDLFFAPGGLEAVWAERNPADNTFRFVWTRFNEGIWTKPVVLPFSTEYFNVELCLSQDGKRMFFASNRPSVPGRKEEKTSDIWMSERTESGWGEPQRLGPEINTPDIEAQPYWGSDGKLYFLRRSGKVIHMICSSLMDGVSSEVVPFDFDFSQEQVTGFCISPDNRIMVLHSTREGGFGSWDLYASFKNASGKWGELIHLGKTTNTAGPEGTISFSPDGKYLFFRVNRKVWWVDAGFLEELRPKE